MSKPSILTAYPGCLRLVSVMSSASVTSHDPVEVHVLDAGFDLARLAIKRGIKAPLNATIYALLLPHKDGRWEATSSGKPTFE